MSKLSLTEKQRIKEAARIYMGEKNITQNRLQKLSKVTYLSNIMNGVFTYKNSRTNEEAEIPDKWFFQLAETIGYEIHQEVWPMIFNRQALEILHELEETKKQAYTRIIIAPSGTGKSYTCARFKQINPAGTYLVTCHRFDTLGDLIDKIQEAANIKSEEKSISKRLQRLKTELHRRYRSHENPLLILDEAENLSLHTLQMLKALYDFLQSECGIVLIGTDQLINKLESMKRKNAAGIPQFYRRFKAGIRYLAEIDRSFKDFFEGKNVSLDAQKLLRNICENYGELADYLEPALKKANGEMVTVELLKLLYKL